MCFGEKLKVRVGKEASCRTGQIGLDAFILAILLDVRSRVDSRPRFSKRQGLLLEQSDRLLQCGPSNPTTGLSLRNIDY